MTYTINCVSTAFGWRYRVTLIVGRTEYVGKTVHKDYGLAVRAARRTGAKEVKE